MKKPLGFAIKVGIYTTLLVGLFLLSVLTNSAPYELTLLFSPLVFGLLAGLFAYSIARISVLEHRLSALEARLEMPEQPQD